MVSLFRVSEQKKQKKDLIVSPPSDNGAPWLLGPLLDGSHSQGSQEGQTPTLWEQ